MTLIRNVSPLGEVVNAFTGVVPAGGEVDVPEDIAAALCEQESWEPVKSPAKGKTTPQEG